MTDMTLVALLSAAAGIGILLLGIAFSRAVGVKKQTQNYNAVVAVSQESMGGLTNPTGNAAMSSVPSENNRGASWNQSSSERQAASVMGD
jgi:hypothetical protein